MDWLTVFAVGAVALFLLYAVYQVTISFTWTAEKSARLRRGPTNSPGETLWILATSLFLLAMLLWALA